MTRTIRLTVNQLSLPHVVTEAAVVAGAVWSELSCDAAGK